MGLVDEALGAIPAAGLRHHAVSLDHLHIGPFAAEDRLPHDRTLDAAGLERRRQKVRVVRRHLP